MADAVAVLGFDDREFRTGVQGAVQRMGTLGTAAQGFGTKGKQAGTNFGMGIMLASQAIDDAQYGMRAIINNMNQLVMAFGGGAAAAGSLTIAMVAAQKATPYVTEALEGVMSSYQQMGEAAALGARDAEMQAARMAEYNELVREKIDEATAAYQRRGQAIKDAAQRSEIQQAELYHAIKVAEAYTQISRQIEDVKEAASAERDLTRVIMDNMNARDRALLKIQQEKAEREKLYDLAQEEASAYDDLTKNAAAYGGVMDAEWLKLRQQSWDRIQGLNEVIAKQDVVVEKAMLEMEGMDKLAEANVRLALARAEANAEAETQRLREQEATNIMEQGTEAILSQAEAYKKASEQAGKYWEARTEIVQGLNDQAQYFGDPAGRAIEQTARAIEKKTDLSGTSSRTIARASAAMEAAEAVEMNTPGGQARAARKQRNLEREGRRDARILRRMKEEEGMTEDEKARQSRILGDNQELRKAIEEANKPPDVGAEPPTRADITNLKDAVVGMLGAAAAEPYLKKIDDKLKKVEVQ